MGHFFNENLLISGRMRSGKTTQFDRLSYKIEKDMSEKELAIYNILESNLFLERAHTSTLRLIPNQSNLLLFAIDDLQLSARYNKSKNRVELDGIIKRLEILSLKYNFYFIAWTQAAQKNDLFKTQVSLLYDFPRFTKLKSVSA